MEIIHFGKDKEHEYNPEIMRQYVEVTEKYDAHRKHSIMDVAPEFARIKSDLG